MAARTGTLSTMSDRPRPTSPSRRPHLAWQYTRWAASTRGGRASCFTFLRNTSRSRPSLWDILVTRRICRNPCVRARMDRAAASRSKSWYSREAGIGHSRRLTVTPLAHRTATDRRLNMINVIKSEDRYHGNFGWLDTYYDPANLNWGALRVFNDDVIQPGQGFGMHPHRDMEIVTYVLEGELEHQDNQGNRGVVHPGEVQVMSAGKGIVHSEYNHSKAQPVHLMQLWILPRAKGQKPRWEQHGKLLPIVSSGEIAGTLTIDQDAQIYVASLKRGEQVAHQSRPGRKAYMFAIDGELKVNGVALAKGDQARAADERELKIQAAQDSELILLDLPEVNGARG